MTKSTRQKSRILDVVHEMANDLYQTGIINRTTLREFDTLCIPPTHAFTAKQIKQLRLKESVSQAVFAKCLNISVSTVQQWEQGSKHPQGTSLKLLNLVDKKGLKTLLN